LSLEIEVKLNPKTKKTPFLKKRNGNPKKKKNHVRRSERGSKRWGCLQPA
jgi:hypothetical protein